MDALLFKNNMKMLKENDVEISWFAPICDGDDDLLGSRNPKFKSMGKHVKNYKNS